MTVLPAPPTEGVGILGEGWGVGVGGGFRRELSGGNFRGSKQVGSIGL